MLAGLECIKVCRRLHDNAWLDDFTQDAHTAKQFPFLPDHQQGSLHMCRENLCSYISEFIHGFKSLPHWCHALATDSESLLTSLLIVRMQRR